MFNVRKFMTGFTAIAVSLAMLGMSAGTVFAKSEESNTNRNIVESTNSETVALGQSTVLSSGREGIIMPKSGYSGELDLNQIETSKADHMRAPTGIEFVQPLVQYSVEKTGESVDAFQHGQAYVYFDLTKGQLADWNSGTLAIYYFNGSTWQKLNAMLINRGAYGRLAVRAVGFGSYGVGNVIPTNNSTNGSSN
jgi:hypothetical protein